VLTAITGDPSISYSKSSKLRRVENMSFIPNVRWAWWSIFPAILEGKMAISGTNYHHKILSMPLSWKTLIALSISRTRSRPLISDDIGRRMIPAELQEILTIWIHFYTWINVFAAYKWFPIFPSLAGWLGQGIAVWTEMWFPWGWPLPFRIRSNTPVYKAKLIDRKLASVFR